MTDWVTTLSTFLFGLVCGVWVGGAVVAWYPGPTTCNNCTSLDCVSPSELAEAVERVNR